MPFGPIVQRRTSTLYAGRLRHKVSIVVVSNAQDSTGGISVNTNVLYANVWATVEALSGSEKFAAHEFVSEVTHQVLIRYIGAAPSWLPLTNYIGGAVVKDSNGNLQQATSGGGLSGAIAPTWNVNLSQTTQDGNLSTGIVWKNFGPAPTRTGVNAGMQIQFEGRQFQINAVLNPNEIKKFLILLCIEVNDSNQQTPLLPGASGSFLDPTIISGGTF